MSNMELDVIIRGHVSNTAKNDIVNTLKNCYKNFGARVPYKVEVLITDTEAIMTDYIRQEKFKMGIIENKVEDTICLYDIIKGYPRITLSVEKLERYSKNAKFGLIRHQAAHSILHGSLEYTIFKIPDDLRQIGLVKGIDMNTLETILQKLSLAIKDCEASKLLVEHEFINCQLAFALEWIQPKIDPKMILKQQQQKVDRQQKFINHIELLKPILYSLPLIAAPQSKKISLENQVLLGRRIEELLQIHAPSDQNKILNVANLIVENLTEDTHYNMDTALHQVMSLA